MNKKLLGIAVLIIVLVGGGFLWNRSRNADTDDTNTPVAGQVNTDISYSGVEGQSALALLKATHTVETKTYSFGEMVIAIDGQVATDGTNFWEFLVNGQQATVGAGDYLTKAGDQISWKLTAINAQ